ncbi:LPS export ABC transporter permease LptF [bacterium]|nr:LPS export ABC transporter permease LptF [bacterium]
MIIQKNMSAEITRNAGVIILSLSVILFMEKFIRLARLFMGRGADLADVLKIFIYIQPSLLLLSMPMAILIAIFLTYGRMSADSELIVLKASGMNFLSISRAPIIFSAICVLLLMFVSLYLMPISMQALKRTIYETIVKKASMTFEEKTFSDVFKNTVIFVKDISNEDEFKGIFIYREADAATKEPVMIVAERGHVKSSTDMETIRLSLHNGRIHTYKENSSTEITFSDYDFVLKAGLESSKQLKTKKMLTSDLWDQRKDNREWAIELHRRIALPFACLIFGILGPAIACRAGKIGRLGGFSLSLGILVLYYVLLILGQGMAESSKLSPLLGGWSANIVFGVVAAGFSYYAHIDKPVRRF